MLISDILYEQDQEITQAQLDALEAVLDRVFAKLGIDVEFTRHFLDRVNDERNRRQITIRELGLLFKKEFIKYGKPIAQLGPDAEAVMKDMETDINLPFALRWDANNNELDLIAKTVMRKADFKTSNKTFTVEGYKLKLERDADMMVLHITDTDTGKRTEVRGKAGYETNGYDANDKLHQLLDKISKTANISELMNGEPVGINPKHPQGASAKDATDKAFNEATEMKISDLTISDAGMAIAHSAGGGSRTDAPLAVTKLPSGYVYLVNGYHRLVDAMNSGKDTVSVEYVPYEKVEILWKQEREQDIKYGKQFNK